MKMNYMVLSKLVQHEFVQNIEQFGALSSFGVGTNSFVASDDSADTVLDNC